VATTAAMIREALRLQRDGRAAEAIEAYRQVLLRDPALPDCWFNLGFLLRHGRHYEQALACYQKALEHGVAEPESARLNRAVIYADYLRRDEAAERELLAALELNPRYVPGMLNLANLHEDRGRREAARVLYARAFAVDPACFLALARYANLQLAVDGDESLPARLRLALDSPVATLSERADLGFALGRLLDQAGDYPAAFAAYAQANRDSRASRPAAAHYDRVAQESLTDRLIATSLPSSLPPPVSAGPRLVFICGMFRSGSTLAEQLLAGAPGVAAGGELDLIPAAVATQLAPFPEALQRVSSAALGQLADEYRQSIVRLFPGAQLVTDKRPDNFLYIGLIKTLFPEAKIVHTIRAPLDTCLSTFFLHLDHRMNYALDLLDTGHYYRQYRRVMAHWQQLYGDDIIAFDYDHLVEDPAGAGAALCAALGLPWDRAYLDFPRADRSVKTASVWQVREPLYRRSSGRARHYEQELAALRESLADLQPVRAAVP